MKPSLLALLLSLVWVPAVRAEEPSIQPDILSRLIAAAETSGDPLHSK